MRLTLKSLINPPINCSAWARQLILLSCFIIPPAYSGQLAIIIDDLGYNSSLGKRTINLPGDFTLAFLPFTPHGRELAEQAHRMGKELILHAPMSNIKALPLGKNALLSGMKPEAFTAALGNMLAEIPHIKGLNNHMGSQLTQEQLPMNWLMSELSERNLYFVDSRTSAASLALQTAKLYQVPSVKRDVFLDNQRDSEIIQRQLHKALTLAQRQGKAIAIGHPYPETLAILEKIQPLLTDYQVELVSVSQLLLDSLQSEPILQTKPIDCCTIPSTLPPPLLRRASNTETMKAHVPSAIDWINFSYEPW